MRRQIRRPGPPLALSRVSFLPGTTAFPAAEFSLGSVFQGYYVEAGLGELLKYVNGSSQNGVFADSRLVYAKFVFPPNTTNVPLGVDILLMGFPQLDTAGGTMVGHTTKFLSLTNSTNVNCRLPPAVRQQFIADPATNRAMKFRIQFRYYAAKPSTAAVLPVVTVELRFRQQPIQTVIVA